MEFEHPKYGRLVVKELTQRDVEALFGYIRRDRVAELGKVEYDGAVLRKAAELGVITEPKIASGDVDNLSPAKVRWMADSLGDALSDSLTVDPLS